MFEFNFPLQVYAIMTFMALFFVLFLFYLELELCDKSDPQHFQKIALSIGRSFLLNIVLLIIIVVIPLLIMDNPPIPWSVSDKLFMLITFAFGALCFRWKTAALEVGLKRQSKRRSRK